MEFWDTCSNSPGFTPARAWLVEPFDIVHCHEVSVAEHDQLTLEYNAASINLIAAKEFSICMICMGGLRNLEQIPKSWRSVKG